MKKYWATVSDQVDLFKSGGSTLGASWPVMLSTLLASKAPVASVIPKEGATGWLDTWMLPSKAKHPNCAYKWLAYISTPKVQAQQATNYGETPVNSKACSFMNKISAGSCKQYFANAPERTTARSSSGRRRSPTAATARRTAWTTRSGFRPGRTSRASPA